MSADLVVHTECPSVLAHEVSVEPAVATQRVEPFVLVREPRHQTVVRDDRPSVSIAGGNQGPQGPPGPPGDGTAYVHAQSSAALTWTINHNLGYRPSVELLDVGGREYTAEVLHTSANQVVVYHDIATAGTARLN